LRFCTRTKNLSEEENTKFAKDLKAFTKKETEKFQRKESQEDQESEE